MSDDHTHADSFQSTESSFMVLGIGTYVRGGLSWHGKAGPRCKKCQGPIVVTHVSSGISTGLAPLIENVYSDAEEARLEKRRNGHTVVWSRDGLEARCMTLLMGKE